MSTSDIRHIPLAQAGTQLHNFHLHAVALVQVLLHSRNNRSVACRPPMFASATYRNCNIPDPPLPSSVLPMVLPAADQVPLANCVSVFHQVAAAGFAEEWAVFLLVAGGDYTGAPVKFMNSCLSTKHASRCLAREKVSGSTNSQSESEKTTLQTTFTFEKGTVTTGTDGGTAGAHTENPMEPPTLSTSETEVIENIT